MKISCSADNTVVEKHYKLPFLSSFFSSLLEECKWPKDRCDIFVKRIKVQYSLNIQQKHGCLLYQLDVTIDIAEWLNEVRVEFS